MLLCYGVLFVFSGVSFEVFPFSCVFSEVSWEPGEIFCQLSEHMLCILSDFYDCL